MRRNSATASSNAPCLTYSCANPYRTKQSDGLASRKFFSLSSRLESISSEIIPIRSTMSCPHFEPKQRLPWERWKGRFRPPLGALHEGLCRVNGEAETPPPELLLECCNM